MAASIGKIASPSQGVAHFERDGYYAKDDAAHLDASAWAGRGTEVLSLFGPVDPERFRSVLAGEVPGGRRLGRREIGGNVVHHPDRDVTMSTPKSMSLMALVGGDERIVEAHDRAVAATLARDPGVVTVGDAERAISALELDGSLHAARGLNHGRQWATDAALAWESETIALIRAGQGAERKTMRRWVAETKLHRGRLNQGQKEAVKAVLASKDRARGCRATRSTSKAGVNPARPRRPCKRPPYAPPLSAQRRGPFPLPQPPGPTRRCFRR